MTIDNTGAATKRIVETILAAEVVSDPLDRIVERAAVDPGAPYHPAALQRLANLQVEDRPTFETLRRKLKEAGCRVVQLDRAIAKMNGGANDQDMGQADNLVELASRAAEYFHTPDGTGYADIDVNGHRETAPIHSKSFRRWLRLRYYEATRRAPSSEALIAAMSLIEAMAQFDAPEREVQLRVFGLYERYYVDLADDAWRAIEVDAAGWRVVRDPTVRFRRAPGMAPLPDPIPGGSIELLRDFLNVNSDADFVLTIAWLLAGLRARGPYPILVLTGEQGSAKSFFMRVLRSLVDPNTTGIRSLPRDERDLFIAANNGHVLAFDNISALTPSTSDALCRLATGGGFATRKLCTDQDEVLFDGQRPIVLNGIEDFVARPDLADRAIGLTLEPIPEDRRRSEAELWAAFNVERPRILGALLDAVVEGIRRLPETRLEMLPRMADFALWATACESAYWSAGTFMAAYAANRAGVVENVIDADPIAAAVRSLMETHAEWAGTSTDLLNTLTIAAGDAIKSSSSWPKSSQTLSGRLRRAATPLRKVGIDIKRDREAEPVHE